MEHIHCTTIIREPWNKGKLVGQKAPFKLKEIWAIPVRDDDCRRPPGGLLYSRELREAPGCHLRYPLPAERRSKGSNGSRVAVTLCVPEATGVAVETPVRLRLDDDLPGHLMMICLVGGCLW
jgi:hypothetical protein